MNAGLSNCFGYHPRKQVVSWLVFPSTVTPFQAALENDMKIYHITDQKVAGVITSSKGTVLARAVWSVSGKPGTNLIAPQIDGKRNCV